MQGHRSEAQAARGPDESSVPQEAKVTREWQEPHQLLLETSSVAGFLANKAVIPVVLGDVRGVDFEEDELVGEGRGGGTTTSSSADR